jgi:hypothetical protein
VKFSSICVARGCWKGLKPDPEIRGYEGHSQVTCKHACGRDWINPGIIGARDQQEKDWGAGVLGVSAILGETANRDNPRRTSRKEVEQDQRCE